jgi:hypothetical protein
MIRPNSDPRTVKEELEVKINYRVPESVMNGLVAGACFVAIHNALGALLERRWSLPKNGRRPRHATGGVLR